MNAELRAKLGQFCKELERATTIELEAKLLRSKRISEAFGYVKVPAGMTTIEARRILAESQCPSAEPTPFNEWPEDVITSRAKKALSYLGITDTETAADLIKRVGWHPIHCGRKTRERISKMCGQPLPYPASVSTFTLQERASKMKFEDWCRVMKPHLSLPDD